jgi:diguanylate cyclase (GGDEF)-like protein/PAS domain S-box-containing protein
MKIAFNTGQLVTAAAIGTALSHHLGAGVGDLTDRALLAAVAGVLAYSVLSMLAVAGIISLVQRTPFWSAVLDGLDLRIAAWVASLAIGLLLTLAIYWHSWMFPVATLPIAMLQITSSRSFTHYRQRRQMEKLYEATAAMRATIDSKLVKEQLVRAVYTLLDAGADRLVDTAAPPLPGALRVPLDPGTAIEVSGRLGGGTWNNDDEFLVRALASVASNALANATMFEQVRTITGSLGEGVVAVDHQGRIEFVNPAVEAILGWTSAELLGREPHETLHRHEIGTGDCPLLSPLLTGRTAKNDDGLFSCRDGSRLPVAYTASPVVRDGQLMGVVIAFHDITERKSFEQQLTHQAFHDALTGLPNRALFLDRLGHAQARVGRTGGHYAVLFIDVDRFKVVNDSLGHHVGDELLVQVAARLEGSLRPSDTLARFGGDEFVALLEDLHGEDGAVVVAKRLLGELRRPFRVAQRDVAVSCSIGVVVGDRRHQDPDECLREGDVAMYRAKARGKDCYEVFHHQADTGQLRRLDLEIELRRALEREEFELHYQPVVSTETGLIAGIEALVRWRHRTRGLVAPGEFIPLAEETGLILPLGRWVLEEACRQAKAWEQSCPGSAPLVMSVNLSPRQFRQPDLDREVAEALDRSGLEPSRLCIEMTEGSMVDVESAMPTLQKLRDLGVSVAIDDFGTGYSSLSYLKRLPIDYVKIDRSFIQGLGQETVDSEIVHSVVRLASAIGIRAVAEGVETEAQLRSLRSLGCPLVQGYHLARPQPAAEVEVLLQGLAAAS